MTATAAGRMSVDRLGKRKKLRVFVVTVTPAVSKSMERLGKKKSFPVLWCQ